jgi:hypothetical protein
MPLTNNLFLFRQQANISQNKFTDNYFKVDLPVLFPDLNKNDNEWKETVMECNY